MRQLLKAHPEIRRLVGNVPATAGWIAAAAGAQIGVAAMVAATPWWSIILAAYTIGAVLALGLWTLLHECTHDLVLQRSTANRWLGILTALPLGLPAATTFRKCHLMHHRHLGDARFDGDIASPWEARLVGNCPLRKAIWLMCAAATQSLRLSRMRGIRILDRWFAANLALQLAFNGGVVMLIGWGGLAYLVLANIFSIGLHPLGGRWIQEHYVLRPGQETYSYYGPMNRFVFNAGYHNEHHDLMRIAWMRLPRVTATAPEFYAPLHAHRSWTALLLRFLFDPELTLETRVVRGSIQDDEAEAHAASPAATGKTIDEEQPDPQSHPV